MKKKKKHAGKTHPSFMFYPKDWLTDTALRRVGSSAKGLWIDLLCIMWVDEPVRGKISCPVAGIEPPLFNPINSPEQIDLFPLDMPTGNTQNNDIMLFLHNDTDVQSEQCATQNTPKKVTQVQQIDQNADAKNMQNKSAKNMQNFSLEVTDDVSVGNDNVTNTISDESPKPENDIICEDITEKANLSTIPVLQVQQIQIDKNGVLQVQQIDENPDAKFGKNADAKNMQNLHGFEPNAKKIKNADAKSMQNGLLPKHNVPNVISTKKTKNENAKSMQNKIVKSMQNQVSQMVKNGTFENDEKNGFYAKSMQNYLDVLCRNIAGKTGRINDDLLRNDITELINNNVCVILINDGLYNKRMFREWAVSYQRRQAAEHRWNPTEFEPKIENKPMQNKSKNLPQITSEKSILKSKEKEKYTKEKEKELLEKKENKERKEKIPTDSKPAIDWFVQSWFKEKYNSHYHVSSQTATNLHRVMGSRTTLTQFQNRVAIIAEEMKLPPQIRCHWKLQKTETITLELIVSVWNDIPGILQKQQSTKKR